MTRLYICSDIPKCITPDSEKYPGLFVRIKSVRVADVGVTLVGSVIS